MKKQMSQKLKYQIKKKLLFSLVLSCVSFFLANAQIEHIKTMKNWELLGYGKDAERVGDNYSAIDYYSEFVKRKPNDFEVSYKLAKMYFDINNFLNAKQLFEKILKQSAKKYPNSMYYLAEILRTESKFDSAINLYTKYQDRMRDRTRGNLLYHMAEIGIESCTYAADNTQLMIDYEVKHLNTSINKAHMESSPIILNDSIFVYSSLIADSVPIVGSGNKEVRPYHKFYKAELINKTWSGGFEATSKPFFDFDSLNVANGAFSEDNNRFYFTLSHRNKNERKVSSIYVSHKKNHNWSKPEKLNGKVNEEGYINSQPAVCNYLKDYEIIYFVSNRPGGWGSYDIWYSVYNKSADTYNKAVNAGGYINSAGADITPYYVSSTKTMYFSSNAQIGYGGFDIYRTNGALVEWLPPENLGLPLNSNYNDIYYKKYKNKESGFFVSNRDESIDLKNPNCCYDIFEYKLPEKNDISIEGVVAIKDESGMESKETVINESVIIENAGKKRIQLWMVSSVTGISVLMERGVTDDDGRYKFAGVEEDRDYIIRVDDKTMLKKPLSFDTKNTISDTTILLDTIYLRPIPKKPIIFQNIYFEFGKATLTAKSKETIDKTIYKIMTTNKEIIVEIGAHTDYLGKSDSNLKLSQKRAESVVNYLIEKGIGESRLNPVGYGEEKPIIESQTATGKDIPEAREKNRRIEFTVIGTNDEK